MILIGLHQVCKITLGNIGILTKPLLFYSFPCVCCYCFVSWIRVGKTEKRLAVKSRGMWERWAVGYLGLLSRLRRNTCEQFLHGFQESSFGICYFICLVQQSVKCKNFFIAPVYRWGNWGAEKWFALVTWPNGEPRSIELLILCTFHHAVTVCLPPLWQGSW